MNNSTQSTNSSPVITGPGQVTIGDLLTALHANLPNLSAEQRYTLQELVGDDLWHSMRPGLRKRLGHAFKQLVESNDQPVKWAGRRSNNCQVYELK